MAAAAGPVVVAGDEEKNPQSISLIHKAYVVVPTTLEGRSDEKSEEKSNSVERKINNENWRVYFQPEEVIAYITANKDTTSLIMHVKMEMVGEQFENRDSIIYLTTDEFIEKYTHDGTTGPTVAPSPAISTLTGPTPAAAAADPTAATLTAPTITLTDPTAAIGEPAIAAAAATNPIPLATTGGPALRFKVGIYDKTYPGWHRATAADWKNSEFQKALVQAHQEGGGWPLLEEPLLCNTALNVEEGWARIDGERIVEVGYTNGTQQLRGVYPAMNFGTEVAWTTTAPTLGDNWTVKNRIGLDYPCLFVQDGNVPETATPASTLTAIPAATENPVVSPVVDPAASDTRLGSLFRTRAITKILPLLTEEEGRVLKAIGNQELTEEVAKSKNLLGIESFAAGYYLNLNKYTGWRYLTKEEWINPAIQKQFLQAYQKNNGWRLLEPMQKMYPSLSIQDFYAKADRALIKLALNEVVLENINAETNISWGITPPTISNNMQNSLDNWMPSDVIDNTYLKHPFQVCLFVKEDFALAIPEYRKATVLTTQGATVAATESAAAAAAGPEAVTASNALDIMVGYRNKHYNGYRMVTTKDIERPEWREKLIEAHMIHGGGWPLLEQNLNCEVTLRVQEGALRLNNISVCGLKCAPKISINNKYEPCPVTTKDNKYTTDELRKIKYWTVSILDTNEGKAYPCLFVKEEEKEEE